MRFAGPDSNEPTSFPTDTLNLDIPGKPLTYFSAKRGPDKLHWEAAETEEIIRLIRIGTIFPIAHSRVPQDRWTNGDLGTVLVWERRPPNKENFTSFSIK